uniref:Uncharacterized protein n=1 Tax=Oryza barthii TaxID=65489 RepID=A0A0D3G3Q9_9ORYZ
MNTVPAKESRGKYLKSPLPHVTASLLMNCYKLMNTNLRMIHENCKSCDISKTKIWEQLTQVH